MNQDSEKPNEESIRLAMDQAWRDHHHARDQTWKTVQIEAVLGAGLVTVDAQFGLPIATTAAGALVVVATIFGILITIHHRALERRKFIHITNCERALGLHRDDLIPGDLGDENQKAPNESVVDAAVSVPSKIRAVDVFNPGIRNTSIFILRMHAAIMLFALIVVMARIVTAA